MEALLAYLTSEGGVVGSMLAASMAANVAQYRQNQTMHRENRESDRSTLMQLFDALALIREIRDSQRGGQ